jgi:O-antigen/teichoic acid export membrane protein
MAPLHVADPDAAPPPASVVPQPPSSSAPRAPAPQMPGATWALLRNTGWNLAGESAPALAALLAIPILIRTLGTARFGVFTIMWTIFTGFGGCDLGLGSAVTKFIAERIALERRAEVSAIFWTSLAMTAALGLAAAAALAAAARWLTAGFLTIPPALRAESHRAFLLLALGLPLLITVSVLRGTLSAFQRFDIINKTRMPTGAFFFAGPLLILPFSHSLVWMVAVQIAGRAATWMAYFLCCLRLMPSSPAPADSRWAFVRPLLGFGGWVAVFNVCGSLLAYADRLIPGAMLPMAAVAWLATAQELVARALAVPGAVMSVAMPALTEHLSVGADAARLLKRATGLLFAILFPLVLAMVIFAREGLALWVGAGFAAHAALPLRWCAVGALLANGIAGPSFALTQAAHRPDLPSKTRVLELLVYVPVMWMLCRSYGVDGAAAGYALRFVAEGIVWMAYAGRLLPAAAAWSRDVIVAAVLLGGAIMLIAPGLSSFAMQAGFFAAALALFAAWFWRAFLSDEDRRVLSGAIPQWMRA